MSSSKICVVAGIPEKNVLVHRFARVLEPLVECLVLITGNYPEKDVFSDKIQLVSLHEPKKTDILLVRICNFIVMQCKYAWLLLKNLRGAGAVIFYLDGGISALPMIVAKAANKRTIIVITHSVTAIYNKKESNRLLSIFANILKSINFHLADKLIVYSSNMQQELGLADNKKVIIARQHFVDFNIFKETSPLAGREKIVGYIGRLSKEKGITNFLEAASILIAMDDTLTFYVIGDGELRSFVLDYIKTRGLQEKIIYFEWIANEELYLYLNRIRLLVIPSYTEGLVNIMMEAMACGTPVLANAVGAIPDVIEDGKNGFLLENNLPQTIAEGVCAALNNPNLGAVSSNALKFVKDEFTFEHALEQYRTILET